MIKHSIFASIAAALQNLDDNKCEDHRSCWEAEQNKYTSGESFPTCMSDVDCPLDGYYCLEHMWSYNDQIESGKGCVKEGVCRGNGTW